MLRNYVSGVNERFQDALLRVKRCGGCNYISRFKIINHNKRHLSKPKELAKMIKTGKIRRGEWFIYDGGFKCRCFSVFGAKSRVDSWVLILTKHK